MSELPGTQPVLVTDNDARVSVTCQLPAGAIQRDEEMMDTLGIDTLGPTFCDESDTGRSVCSNQSTGSQSEFYTKKQTILIFDWDDTLLPSSWLKRNNCLLTDMHVKEEVIAPLALVAKSVKALLDLAQQFGEVVIVTNAEQGWIDLSCRKWFPELHSYIMSFQLTSARSTWEPMGVVSPCGWKARAFKDVIEFFYSRFGYQQSWKNVISIGDSPHEREALMRVTLGATLKGCRTKSVSLMIRPSANQLKKQLDMMCVSLQQIVYHDDHLDLQMQDG